MIAFKWYFETTALYVSKDNIFVASIDVVLLYFISLQLLLEHLSQLRVYIETNVAQLSYVYKITAFRKQSEYRV